MVTWTILNQEPPLGGRPNIKTRRPWHSQRSHLLIYSTYDFTLHLRVRDYTTWFWRWSWDGHWTLSFGLSQFHGCDSWLMWEVALTSFRMCEFLSVFCLLFYIGILHIPWWQFPCGAPISTDTRNMGHDFHSLDLLFLIHLLADRTKCFFVNPEDG